MISRRRIAVLTLALGLTRLSAAGGQLESFGSFVSGGAAGVTGNVEVFDAIGGGVVTSQNSVSYIARNGWLASRILIVAPAGMEQRPLIVDQPRDIRTVPGSSARFRVGAVSNSELSYQWRLGGQPIAGAESATLELANVTIADAGEYDVVITAMGGSAVSVAARLDVIGRLLALGSVQTTNLNKTVTVPLLLSGDGQEHAVAGSVAFGTAELVLDQVVNRGAATLTTNASVAGAVGLEFALGGGATYSAGTNHLCDLVFRPVAITNQTIVNLAFSEVPVSVGVRDGASNSLPVVPRNGSITFRQPVTTTVNPESGGFDDKLMLVTPDDGSGASLYVRVLIHDLGADSLGNPIRVLNAAGTNENGVPFVLFPGSVQPGQAIELALEYYVSDRITSPNPRFETETFPESFVDLPVGLTVIPLSRGLIAAGKFYVDFATEAEGVYYIQYRDNDVAGNWQTSLPAIIGNGSTRQWIDNGPPGTGSKPVAAGARFYRVVKAP